MVAGRDAGQPGVGVSESSRENCRMTNLRGRTRCTGLAGVLALTLLASPLATQAQVDTKMASEKMAGTDKKEDAGPWSGTIAAGYAKTSGNSESSAANFKGEGRYDKNRWHQILGATAVGTSSAANRDEDSETTAEAYWAGFQSQYDLTEAFYGFGAIDWYKDRFSAYDQQLFETAGIGWRILRGEAHFLDLEVGGGAKQAQLTSGEDQNEGIGVVRGIYTWKISKNATFVQKVAVLSGSDNTFTETISELKAGIVGNLSMVLGYTYRHNSDVEIDTSLVPPRDFDKTDTFTTVSLEYGF
jgi:putative salt-induced outer membrane protein